MTPMEQLLADIMHRRTCARRTGNWGAEATATFTMRQVCTSSTKHGIVLPYAQRCNLVKSCLYKLKWAGRLRLERNGRWHRVRVSEVVTKG
jgi:hypothetical protein